jgi:protein gp37
VALMAEKTTIAWTESSWNPLRARRPDGEGEGPPIVGWSCVRVSPGCTHCYAATMNRRLGTGLDYTVPDNARVQHFISEKQLREPLGWKKPRRVFVCSMTDLFGEWVTDEQILRVWTVMHAAPQHTFQVLTKRPERARSILSRLAWATPTQAERDAGARGFQAHLNGAPAEPLPNVWLGVSAEDQQRADERIPILLDTPAAVRWVSAEPLIGGIDFCGIGGCCTAPGLDWIVTGGESGPGARPMDLAWARSIRDQCAAAGVAYFHKQNGAGWAREHNARGLDCGPADRKGEHQEHWPPDLRVREYPAVRP